MCLYTPSLSSSSQKEISSLGANLLLVSCLLTSYWFLKDLFPQHSSPLMSLTDIPETGFFGPDFCFNDQQISLNHINLTFYVFFWKSKWSVNSGPSIPVGQQSVGTENQLPFRWVLPCQVCPSPSLLTQCLRICFYGAFFTNLSNMLGLKDITVCDLCYPF